MGLTSLCWQSTNTISDTDFSPNLHIVYHAGGFLTIIARVGLALLYLGCDLLSSCRKFSISIINPITVPQGLICHRSVMDCDSIGLKNRWASSIRRSLPLHRRAEFLGVSLPCESFHLEIMELHVKSEADDLTYSLDLSIAWYIAAANLLTAETSFLVLPVVDLRYVIRISFIPV